MQAFVHTQLVKVASSNVKANVRPASSAKEPAREMKTAKGFLAVLLSCLSAWGT